MRFASLGSGSSGNALLAQEKATNILLDCGFGIKDTLLRLARLGVIADQLTGIIVTHEHDDHASGVFKLALQFNIPVWLTHGTFKMSARYLPNNANHLIHIIDSQSSFVINDLSIQPFTVPHDAREPVQYTLNNGQHKLGVLTDVGMCTPHIIKCLSGCDALVLECNHDLDMLEKGPYARSLKQRVGSDLGHLNNQHAAELLGRLDNSKLKHIVAAHLSAKNNTPDLAQSALANTLNCEKSWIGIADQISGFDWRELN